MANKQAPWSVRGVDQEARAKAAKAAERRRMTLGEWVTNALITVANGELGSGPSGAAISHNAEKATGGALQVPSQEAPAQHVPAEITQAVETLTRRIEESGKREKAVGDLVERLDALVHADRSVTELAGRDNQLVAAAERLVAYEHSSEQRLTVLTSAVTTLANRLEWAKEAKERAATTEDVARAIAPLRMALDSYVLLGGAVATAPGHSATAAQSQFGTEEPVAMPQESRPPDEAVTQPIVPLDYDRLHEKAIGNTRRLFADDVSEPTAKGGLMSRLFGD